MRARLMRAGALASLSLLAALGCGETETAAPTPTAPPEAPPAEAAPPPEPPPPPARPGPTCTYHGWCWVSPSPQGNTLHGVWAGRTDLVIAVGERGTAVRYDGEGWAIEDTPTRELLRDVWGTPSGTAWAVGEAGTVLRRDDEGAWSEVDAGTERALYALYGRGDDAVWALGEAGTILRFDGETWTDESVETPMRFVDAWGGQEVYALAIEPIGDDAHRAALHRRTDSGWVEVDTYDADLAAVFVQPQTELVLLAGADARHRAGALSGTQTKPLGLDRPVNAVWGAGDAAFAVGYEGRIARWDGRRWRRESNDETRDLHALSGTAPNDVWAVGAAGAILHYDGEAWTVQSTGPSANLEAIAGRAADDVWAVGDHVLMHWNGSAWSAATATTRDGIEGVGPFARGAAPFDHDMGAIHAAGGDLLAVGDGVLFRYASGAWRPEPWGGDAELTGVWASDGDHAVVVGKTAWLERADGEWREHDDRPMAAGVWGAARDDVWVAGQDGLHHWDGAAWTHVDDAGDAPLYGVWGAAADDVWAVGPEGRVLHHDGSSWTRREVPTRQNLLGVWGTGATDVWAVGDHGTILHFDGEAWRWRDSGTDHVLHAVWGSGPDDVWVVGHDGTVLHHAGPP